MTASPMDIPTHKVYTYDMITIPKKDDEILEEFGSGIIEADIEEKDIIHILTLHKELLEKEIPETEDLVYHKLRQWIAKNLFKVIADEYLDPSCDKDVEEMLISFSWIIKYLVQIHTMIKEGNFELLETRKKFARKFYYLIKTDIYFANRTNSKVEYAELIHVMMKDLEKNTEWDNFI